MQLTKNMGAASLDRRALEPWGGQGGTDRYFDFPSWCNCFQGHHILHGMEIPFSPGSVSQNPFNDVKEL